MGSAQVRVSPAELLGKLIEPSLLLLVGDDAQPSQKPCSPFFRYRSVAGLPALTFWQSRFADLSSVARDR